MTSNRSRGGNTRYSNTVEQSPEKNDELYTFGEYSWQFGLPPNFLERSLKIAKEWRAVKAPELQGGDRESFDPQLPELYLRHEAQMKELWQKSLEMGRRRPGEL